MFAARLGEYLCEREIVAEKSEEVGEGRESYLSEEAEEGRESYLSEEVEEGRESYLSEEVEELLHS